MIIEMRSYDLRPGSIPAVEERFAAALPARTALSPLAAFWHTEIGPLNRVIHVWTYADLAERTRIRAEAAKLPGWPPPISDYIAAMTTEIYLPAPFSPPLTPRAVGAVYEIRTYTMGAGQIPGMIERWAPKIEARAALSPLVGAWYSEIGGLNKWTHIWAYDDAAHRQRVRAEAVAKGIWPPGSPPGAVVKQENMLVIPASFSPLR